MQITKSVKLFNVIVLTERKTLVTCLLCWHPVSCICLQFSSFTLPVLFIFSFLFFFSFCLNNATLSFLSFRISPELLLQYRVACVAADLCIWFWCSLNFYHSPKPLAATLVQDASDSVLKMSILIGLLPFSKKYLSIFFPNNEILAGKNDRMLWRSGWWCFLVNWRRQWLCREHWLIYLFSHMSHICFGFASAHNSSWLIWLCLQTHQ